MLQGSLPSILLVSSLLASPAFARQSTLYVDDDACPGPGSGTSADPYCKIQTALAAAVSGDRIWVRPGTYLEDVNFLGKDVHVLAVGGPAVTGIATSGDGACVTFDSGEGAGAVLEGFLVGGGAGFAQGIRCSASSPTIQGNWILFNFHDGPGGGIEITNGSAPAILGNRIEDNFSSPPSGQGGGIYCLNSAPWIHGNVILRNGALADPGCRGAGVCLLGSSAVLENNLIAGNNCCDLDANFGAGIYISGGTPVLLGNTVSGNVTCPNSGVPSLPGGDGGGIYVQGFTSGGPVTIQDTILWGNQAAKDGDEIYAGSGTVVSLDYSNVDMGIGKIDGAGTVTLGTGNLSVDPQFQGAQDYHLASTSPMIDSGSPLHALGGTDGDVEPRVLDGDLNGAERVDIGWDEFDWTTLTATGTATLGDTLKFDTLGAGVFTKYILAFSRRTGDQPHTPWGSMLIGVPTLRIFGVGALPGSDSLSIPVLPELLGVAFHVQSAAFAPGRSPGSFSRRLSYRIQ